MHHHIASQYISKPLACFINELQNRVERQMHRGGRLFVATAGVATSTFVACRHLERQRRPLQGCDAPTIAAALPSLRASGVSVVDDIIDPGLVTAIKGTEVWRSMPTSIEKPQPRQRGRSSNPPKAASEWRASSIGRYHRREETFDESDLRVFERVEQRIWPLVEAFFQEEGEQGAKGIFRSELQLLNAVPGSGSQTWHSDNKSHGLSIIIPLVDFTAENGGTQLLVGSHSREWPRVLQQGAQVVHAPVGAIAAYDSRIFHRGLGNETEEGRPAIILCYDRQWSPPPGCGTYGMLANACLAGALNVVSGAWITCASALA